MAKAKTDLVIVESPAKAKTIEKYLGSNYKVTASMGHLRDLPKSTMGVDIENGFVPDYKPVKGREDIIDDLKKKAKAAGIVYLATDPDREGEAISWHLKELLELPDEKARRVTFNEITKKVVNESIAHPRNIDDNLVNAQQARRILDRIVGYKLSPLLWRKIRRGLSAGRVQSVATRMVVDREEEIRGFVPEEYWYLDAILKSGEQEFVARFYGTTSKKLELHAQDEVEKIIAAVEKSPFSVASIKLTEKRRSPSPPFITSTLQQEASRRLGMAPKRTMSVAQALYEGVQIEGHGRTGLITYMRTDSLRLSDDAVADARAYIGATYGKNYLPPSKRVYKNKGASQDAHEAIRPSYIELPPDAVRGSLTHEQWRLYKLIWDRFISCQMEQAVYDLLTIDSLSAGHIFRANHTTVVFAGFTAVYEEGRDDEEESDDGKLPNLNEGEALNLSEITPDQHFTKPPARYSEATLIKALEEKGIGRPSTYAPTVTTVTEREYVLREGKNLRPTPLGEVVTGFMKDKFSDIVDVEFTARMEGQLDEVEEGKKNWKAMLGDFYGGFVKTLEIAQADLSNGRLRIPDEETNLTCELCGSKMVIKMGRFGRYIACSGYPECKNTKPIAEETVGICPLCGGKILKKKSKRGFSYYGCEKSPACAFMTWDAPQKENCETCGKTMFKVRYAKVPICENPACAVFVPEDARGYRKKAETTDTEKETGETAGKASGKKAPAKKTAAKKPAAKKTAAKTTAKKPAAKKTATKTTAKKPAAKKSPVKKASETPPETP